MTTLHRHTKIENVPMSDLRALIQSAYRLGVEPDWLAAVISFESGFNPRAQNPHSKATGLIQFMPSTARALLNASSNDAAIQKLLTMSFADQLVLTERYFAPYRSKMSSLEDTYLAVFYPAAIGTPPDHIVGRPGSAVYNQNKVFDPEGKGYITKDDITSTIRKRFVDARARGAFEVPDGPSSSSTGDSVPPTSPSTTSPDTATLLAIGGAAWALYQLLRKAG
jgi:hypothetical protein